MLVDWLSCSLPWDGQPIASQEFAVPFGSQIMKPTRIKPTRVKTSASDSIMVFATTNRIHFDGNPVKFLTGQNVCGTLDIPKLLRHLVLALEPVYQFSQSNLFMDALHRLDVKLHRVDLTCHYSVGNTDDDTNIWLRACAETATVDRRNRGLLAPAFLSVGWGFRQAEQVDNPKKSGGSRHGNFKFYNKHLELKKRPPNVDDKTLEVITSYTCGKVRAEACFRSPALKHRGLTKLSCWGPETPYQLFNEWIERMDMKTNVELLDNIEENMPRKLRGTYFMWKSGVICKERMSHNTFYSHRRELKKFDIDIAIPPREPKGRSIVLVDIMTAKPTEEPALYEMLRKPSGLRLVA